MWLLEQVRKLLFALSSLMSPLQIPIKPSRAGQSPISHAPLAAGLDEKHETSRDEGTRLHTSL